MTIDELKLLSPYETVLETLCITTYNGSRLSRGLFHLTPDWLELSSPAQERFRQQVYLALQKSGPVNALEKALRVGVE